MHLDYKAADHAKKTHFLKENSRGSHDRQLYFVSITKDLNRNVCKDSFTSLLGFFFLNCLILTIVYVTNYLLTLENR